MNNGKEAQKEWMMAGVNRQDKVAEASSVRSGIFIETRAQRLFFELRPTFGSVLNLNS
jgi:hypothetical protein